MRPAELVRPDRLFDEIDDVAALGAECLGSGEHPLGEAASPGAEGGNPAVGYVYDENGNLKSDGTLDYFYDFKNRLVEVRNTVGGALVAQYSFDTANRRGMKVTPTETIVFLYDGIQIVEERDGVGAITRQYVWGPGTDELLQQQTPTATYYSHENSIGSVCALTDSIGTVVERYQYDPFGNTTVTLNGNTGNRYRFHTMFDDPETDLHHTDNRAYNPRLGRWMQRDPIGGWGDPINFGNALAFVGNDPIGRRDPMGLAWYNDWEDFKAAAEMASEVPGAMVDVAVSNVKATGQLISDVWSGSGIDWGTPQPGSAADIAGKHGGEGMKKATQWCMGVSAAAAVAAGGSSALGLEVNVLSKGNVLKVISKTLKAGFRIDPAHHGKPWGHWHFWKW